MRARRLLAGFSTSSARVAADGPRQQGVPTVWPGQPRTGSERVERSINGHSPRGKPHHVKHWSTTPVVPRVARTAVMNFKEQLPMLHGRRTGSCCFGLKSIPSTKMDKAGTAGGTTRGEKDTHKNPRPCRLADCQMPSMSDWESLATASFICKHATAHGRAGADPLVRVLVRFTEKFDRQQSSRRVIIVKAASGMCVRSIPIGGAP